MGSGMEDSFARSCYAAPDRILVATALTDLEYLTPQAVAQAEAAQAELVFVHAISSDAPAAQTTFYNPLKADRDARLTLEVLARHIRARNIACCTVVRHGQPAEVIEEMLREKSAGRLIAGRRATAGAAQDSLGSTAGQLVLETPVPVCCLPPQAAACSDGKSRMQRSQYGLGLGEIEVPQTILYPVGEDGPHPEGVRFALDLAQYLHANLILLQVVDSAAKSGPASFTSCSAGLWPSVRSITRPDASVGTLLEAVRETGAEMLLVEAPPSLGGNATVPATLSELVAQAPCPLLTYPVLPWNRKHSELHVLSGSYSDSTSLSSLGIS